MVYSAYNTNSLENTSWDTAEILKFRKISVELLVWPPIRQLHYISALQKTRRLLSTGWKTECATMKNCQFAVKLLSQSDNGPHC